MFQKSDFHWTKHCNSQGGGYYGGGYTYTWPAYKVKPGDKAKVRFEVVLEDGGRPHQYDDYRPFFCLGEERKCWGSEHH